MKLIFNGSQSYIIDTVTKVNEILNNPLFFEALGKLPQFDNTELTAVQIAGIMKNSSQEIQVKLYWSFNPLRPRTCVNAKTGSANLIKINTRCFSRSLNTAVNTLMHECTHAADYLDGKLDFTHYDNANDGEEDNTAPWSIGALAVKFI